MYNKTIIEFGFCDIRNNQGRGKCNQPRPEVEADNTCRDFDYSGYHKNRIQLLFYYTLFYGNHDIQNLLCEMQVDFICASKNTRTNAPSGRITRNHSSAHAL